WSSEFPARFWTAPILWRFSEAITLSESMSERTWPFSSPSPRPSPLGRDFAEMKFRNLNPRTAANSVRSDLFIARAKHRERISLSSSGGEGWGEEAVFSYPGGSWGEGRVRGEVRGEGQDAWESDLRAAPHRKIEMRPLL